MGKRYRHFRPLRVRRPKARFDARSIRTISVGRHGKKIRVACPKGRYKRGRCSVGMRPYSCLVPRNQRKPRGIGRQIGPNPQDTPYQRLKKSRVKSTWYSPDGFSKIEEFDNGERYHHHPSYSFPIRMTPVRSYRHKKQYPKSRGVRRNPRRLSVPERHQLKVARQTLRMPDAMVGVMGGPNKAQAREIIARLGRRR